MRRSFISPQHRTRSSSALSFIPAICSVRIAAIAIAGAGFLCHAAEGPVASVQRSLKEQQFYYGEVSGNLDEETRAALRRFQIHQGLPVSAELDTATLQALQSGVEEAAARPEPAPGAPEVDRSVRGRAQNLVQDDREFLKQIEPPGEAYTAGPPEVRPDRPEIERTPPPPPIAAPPKRPLPEYPGAAEPRRIPELEPASITPNEAREFVEEYLNAAKKPTPDEEVSFFADKVDYFDSGKVSRQFIEKDQRNYYRRWNSRDFRLIGQPEILKATDQNATIRFRMQYSLKSSRESAAGKTEEIMYLRRAGDDWKISGIRERKLPN